MTEADQKDLVISALVRALYAEHPADFLVVDMVMGDGLGSRHPVPQEELDAVKAYFAAAPRGFEITP